MRNDSTYHSRRPQFQNWTMLPVRRIWCRSTAKTPIWQVTLDAIRTEVLAMARARSRSAFGQGWPRPLSTERIVKYMANSAAKNISSDDSQMMVPTLTRLGRLVTPRGGATSRDAVTTRSLLRHRVGVRSPTPQVGSIGCHEGCRV